MFSAYTAIIFMPGKYLKISFSIWKFKKPPFLDYSCSSMSFSAHFCKVNGVTPFAELHLALLENFLFRPCQAGSPSYICGYSNLLVFFQIPLLSASLMRSSLKSGCAIPMRSSALSHVVLPFRSAAPYSVTM